MARYNTSVAEAVRQKQELAKVLSGHRDTSITPPQTSGQQQRKCKQRKEQIVGKRPRPNEHGGVRAVMMNGNTMKEYFVQVEASEFEEYDEELHGDPYPSRKRSRISSSQRYNSMLNTGSSANPVNLIGEPDDTVTRTPSREHIVIDDSDDGRDTTPTFELKAYDATSYAEDLRRASEASASSSHLHMYTEHYEGKTIHGTHLPARARVGANMNTYAEKYRNPHLSKKGGGEMDTAPCKHWDEFIQAPFDDAEFECIRMVDLIDNRDVELNDGSFFRITRIIGNDYSGETWISGRKMIRSKEMVPIIGGLKNQLVWVGEVHHTLTEQLSGKRYGEIWITPDKIKTLRRIIFSNSPTENEHRADDHEFNPNSTLTCSWKFFVLYELGDKDERIFTEMCVLRMMASEADEGHRQDDSTVRQKFRRIPRHHHKRAGVYTFVDGFSCAGGASAGAVRAGLNAIRAFDKDEGACRSYRRNFPDTACYAKDTYEYCEHVSKFGLPPVDVAHYSPCCQPWSSAKTRRAEYDEANEATLLALLRCLMVDRPRITTLENTSGLWTHQPDWMYGMLGQYTSLDFSVRFAVKNLGRYGVPQARKRFLTIASCPGEALPPFPPETHSPDGLSGLPRFVTLGQAIQNVDFLHSEGFPIPDHMPKEPQKEAYNPKIYHHVARSITTGAGENMHWDGRPLTLRELACIQSFSMNHKFDQSLTQKARKAQIGNAFPAHVTEQLYYTILQSLKKADGLPVTDLPFDHNPRRHTFTNGNGKKVHIVDGSPFRIVEAS